MALPDTFPGVKNQPHGAGGAKRRIDAGKDAFLEALEGILVDPPVPHAFAGAIERETAGKIWTWMARDIADDEAARLADAIDSGADAVEAFDLLLPEILEKLKANAVAERTIANSSAAIRSRWGAKRRASASQPSSWPCAAVPCWRRLANSASLSARCPMKRPWPRRCNRSRSPIL
ncbi:MAG: hypothetical protein CMJ15_06745 [Pelagibacterium sp.]|nr:hypothetical protein [Pelagibacterium sp.]